MSASTAIKAALEADATLLLVATGGIWDWDETGRLGISLETTPAAFDASGIIKPCALVKGRGERPGGGLVDEAAQMLSTREMVEVWFYQDTGYDKTETMKARVFVLLHEQRLSGAGRIYWASHPLVQQRDIAMGNVSVERSDYMVTAIKSP